MKRTVSVILALILGLLPCLSFAAPQEPRIEALSAILLDMDTGEILWEKDSRTKRFPASTTKMITGILALEYLDFNDELTADDEAAAMSGTSIKIKSEEIFKAEDLINGLMVASANDASVVIAKRIAGSVDKFAELMNAKAKEFGALDTNFVNPHGLHDDNHYTTAYDLSQIALNCMKDPRFAKIVGQAHYTMPATNKSAERVLDSTNYLLYDEEASHVVYVNGSKRYCKYEGTIGIKTGQTNAAGGCLVGACERDGTRLLAVVMKSSAMGRFADTMTLFEWGFANYKSQVAIKQGTVLGTVPVKGGTDNKVEVVASENVGCILPAEASKEVLSTTVTLYDSLKAPFGQGCMAGEIALYESGQLISTAAAVTAVQMEKGGILSIFGVPDKTAHAIFVGIIVLFVLLIVSFAAWVIYMRRLTKKKKAEKARRMKEKQAKAEAERLEWEQQYRNRYRDH